MLKNYLNLLLLTTFLQGTDFLSAVCAGRLNLSSSSDEYEIPTSFSLNVSQGGKQKNKRDSSSQEKDLDMPSAKRGRVVYQRELKQDGKEERFSLLEKLADLPSQLENTPITQANVEKWFDIANSLRHEFDNKTAVDLAYSIYEKMLVSNIDGYTQAICIRNQAKINERQGKIQEAIHLLNESLELEPNNPVTLLHLGDAYRITNHQDKEAASYYHLVLKLPQQDNLKKYKAKAHLGIGNARDGNDKVHYHQALELAQEIGDKNLQCQALIGLSNAYCGEKTI